MQKIKTIILKEWAEVFKKRLVLLTVMLLPLLFTAIPLGLMWATHGARGLAQEIPDEFRYLCPPEFDMVECFQAYVLNQFMLLFMFAPLIVPVTIAAYSVVGEKTTRSLEPLLATPITTFELLAGKNLAAAIPAVIGSWISFLIYVVGARALVANPRVISSLFEPMWWLGQLVVGPLFAILSVSASMMVSSRVNEPHVAEQLSAVVVLPLLLLFIGQGAGLIILNRHFVVTLALILAVVDAVMFYLTMRLFQRETILTRWR